MNFYEQAVLCTGGGDSLFRSHIVGAGKDSRPEESEPSDLTDSDRSKLISILLPRSPRQTAKAALFGNYVTCHASWAEPSAEPYSVRGFAIAIHLRKIDGDNF